MEMNVRFGQGHKYEVIRQHPHAAFHICIVYYITLQASNDANTLIASAAMETTRSSIRLIVVSNDIEILILLM